MYAIRSYYALIQFFQQQAEKDNPFAVKVLNAFRDHRTDGQVLWAAYDVRALLPEAFQLKRYRFEAGQYELDFANGSEHIILHRWAPASVLLRKQDLVQFAKTVAGLGKTEPVTGSIAGCETVEWSRITSYNVCYTKLLRRSRVGEI